MWSCLQPGDKILAARADKRLAGYRSRVSRVLGAEVIDEERLAAFLAIPDKAPQVLAYRVPRDVGESKVDAFSGLRHGVDFVVLLKDIVNAGVVGVVP